METFTTNTAGSSASSSSLSYPSSISSSSSIILSADNHPASYITSVEEDIPMSSPKQEDQSSESTSIQQHTYPQRTNQSSDQQQQQKEQEQQEQQQQSQENFPSVALPSSSSSSFSNYTSSSSPPKSFPNSSGLKEELSNPPNPLSSISLSPSSPSPSSSPQPQPLQIQQLANPSETSAQHHIHHSINLSGLVGSSGAIAINSTTLGSSSSSLSGSVSSNSTSSISSKKLLRPRGKNKQKHNESESRRRDRLRVKFFDLRNAAECEKKDRIAILAAAVERLKEYSAKIRNYEAEREILINQLQQTNIQLGGIAAVQQNKSNITGNISSNNNLLSFPHQATNSTSSSSSSSLNPLTGVSSLYNRDKLILSPMSDSSESVSRLLGGYFPWLNSLPCCFVGLDGRFVDVNLSFCALTGYQSSWLLENTIFSITPQFDLSVTFYQLKRALAGEIDAWEIDKALLTADQTIIPVHLSLGVAKSNSGKPEYFTCIFMPKQDNSWLAMNRQGTANQSNNSLTSTNLTNHHHHPQSQQQQQQQQQQHQQHTSSSPHNSQAAAAVSTASHPHSLSHNHPNQHLDLTSTGSLPSHSTLLALQQQQHNGSLSSLLHLQQQQQQQQHSTHHSSHQTNQSQPPHHLTHITATGTGVSPLMSLTQHQ